MYEGHVDHISRHMIQGWALNRADTDKSIDIAISLNGAHLSRATANLPRPDVAATLHLPSAPHGFSVAIPRFLDTAKAHHVQVTFAATGQLIANGERRFPRLDDYDTATGLAATHDLPLSALFVTHLPRSGSTMCMALLHRHPAIIVPERYPFEVKPATYYARAARLLTEPADHESSAAPTEFMRDPVHLGFNPFNHFSFDRVFKDGGLRDHFFERSSRMTLFDALRAVSTDYYRHLAADQSKHAARFFAEKCEAQGIEYGTRASDMALFPEAREILLIRDPRDILCSSRSYFRQPFSNGLMQNLQNGCETIRTIVRQQSKRTLVVKYEALVRDRPATLRSIARFLNIAEDAWLHEPALDASLFKQHATTESPEESIGRWQGDLSESQKEACGKAFAKFLSEFTYNESTSNRATSGPA